MNWTEADLQKKGVDLHPVSLQKSYETETPDWEVSLKVYEGVPTITFGCFLAQRDWMDMRFSTRLGGISTGYLAEMNLGWHRGDSRETVEKNYQVLCDAWGIDASRLVLSDQVHETTVRYVEETYCAGKPLTKKLQGVDGMVTDNLRLPLVTSFADCVPLFFADPVHHVIGTAHSGWRGTVGQIGAKTILTMTSQFGTKASDVIALIGPSICQNCYEVSLDVAEALQDVYTSDVLQEILTPGKAEGKFQLDLWAACYATLKQAGVKPEHIQVSRICTCCQSDLLYSHRASGGKRGNLNGMIWKH